MSKRLTGLNPLAYMGVEPGMPSNTYTATTSPTPNDVQNFNIGDFWVNTTTKTLYVLVNQGRGVATWITTFGGSPITVANGGTGDSSFAPYAVITGGTTSTGPLQNVVGVGTSGQVLTSSGAGALPTWEPSSGGGVTSLTAGTGITLTPSTITTTGSIGLTVPVVVANGGTGDSSFTPYAVTTGGTTSTGPLQNVVGVGTSGQILVSNGAGSLPTWQNNTANIPLTTTITLTSAQIKLLSATPVTVIAAPGSNKTVNILSVVTSFNYGGNNAFTAASGGSNSAIWLFYNINSTNVFSGFNLATQVQSVSQYTATASGYVYINSTFGARIPVSDAVDAPIIVGVTSDNSTEIGGNAAGDNTISIQVTYEIVPVPL